jgi:hypothetical protein
VSWPVDELHEAAERRNGLQKRLRALALKTGSTREEVFMGSIPAVCHTDLRASE